PVVLHISSHGSAEGIMVGGETIAAKALADCVRDVPTLRLLHFGACSVAGGDVPKQIYKELGPSARFPISGYKRTADWAGSAVIDFTYLELVLARGTPPPQAAEQTLKMLSFARDAGEAEGPIAPAGFVC